MKLERKLRIKDTYCQLIRDLAFDYDGCETVESLKNLIDELSTYAYMAINNDDKEIISCSEKYNYNILGEPISERENEEDDENV